jgi:hypothetical protein
MTLEEAYGIPSRTLKGVAASPEASVLVPFTLAALIPELAVRKFAAHEPFTVHVDDGICKRLIAYVGH